VAWYNTFSEKKKQKIRDLYRQLSNGHEVARRLGISSSAAYRVLRLGKYRKPRWSDQEKTKLTQWYAEGVPVARIAWRLGRSPHAVMVKMCRHRKKVRSDPDIKRAAFLLEVALSAGLSPGRAIQKIRTCDAYAKSREEGIV
jgi:transposase-like protein